MFENPSAIKAPCEKHYVDAFEYGQAPSPKLGNPGGGCPYCAVARLTERERKLTIALTNLFYWTVQNHEIGGRSTAARNLAVQEADMMLRPSDSAKGDHEP